METGVPGKIAFVLKGYPRLSETFIAQEILALERRGFDILIVSLRHPTEKDTHPIHDEISAPVLYLPEYLHREPRRVLKAWWTMRRHRRYPAALKIWLGDLRRDFTRNRFRRFGQALVLGHELPAGTTHIYAHFLHTPASTARYAARILGLPWSCSAHAVDIWTTPEWEKREKIEDCAWLVTCTAYNRDHLASHAPDGDRVEHLYHGLDFSRFPAPNGEGAAGNGEGGRDGGDPNDPVVLLCVGRAVEKKGLDILIKALAQLAPSLHWRLLHIGGGALLPSLKRQARRSNISSRIDWLGPMPQQVVLARYRAADLFVLASRIARNGDRDGLPNVLLEAQSQGLACIATRLSAIPELIEDGVTGRLVPADDPKALAGALTALIADPRQRARLGGAGMARVRERFSFEAGIERLAAKFADCVGPPRRQANPPCASPSTRP